MLRLPRILAARAGQPRGHRARRWSRKRPGADRVCQMFRIWLNRFQSAMRRSREFDATFSPSRLFQALCAGSSPWLTVFSGCILRDHHGMDPDVVIGEHGVRDLGLDGGHVTRETTLVWAHGADDPARFFGRRQRVGAGRNRGGGVTYEAFGFVEGRGLLGVTVWAVTGETVKQSAAVGITAAPRQGRAGEANRDWVGARHFPPQRTMTLGTERDDLWSRPGAWPCDREVEEPELNRLKVVFTRPMTPLAADPPIGRLGARLVAHERATVVWQKKQLRISSAESNRPRNPSPGGGWGG